MDDDLDGELLAAVGLGDDDDSRQALAEISSTPLPVEMFHRLRSRLDALLPQTADPGFVLRSLQQFIAASRSPTALLALFERDDHALPTLLRVLGAGHRVADWLVADPESFDLVRASDGAETSRETLVDEIVVELEALSEHGPDLATAARVLGAVFSRERLRIAYADVIGRLDARQVATQLSVLAEAIIESTVQFTRAGLAKRYGEPRTPDGRPGRFAVIGLGPLGGSELSYDSPLDLVFLRDLCGPTDGDSNLPADEFFDLLAAGVLSLLGRHSPNLTTHRMNGDDPTAHLAADESRYDVASSHRPLTDAGSLALTVTEAYRHYQLMGRTWERLLYVKSRCVAGDRELGEEFLTLMRSWVYRRYLEPADIEGLHTLARKIARRVAAAPKSAIQTPAAPDVLACAGGLNDIDAVIGLLLLINGGEHPQLRLRSTLDALTALQRTDCLSLQESTLLTDHSLLLRRYLHCRQAELPVEQKADAGLDHSRSHARIAWHLGFRDARLRGDSDQLDGAIETAIGLNRVTIERLLRDVSQGSSPMPPESELLLEPEPDDAMINATMSRHRMHDAQLAMNDLQRLASEPVPFLSSRRCRHSLAAIATPLLTEIGRTPDPHATLSTLVEVSDSLGGKAVLWELFHAAPPAMHLVVRLCACSPYLSRILIRNPGMIDELVDSLLLDRLPSERWLEASSLELCRGAGDIDAIVASFKNGAHLQIGVRDVLGKESLEATHAALATTAESVLRRISEHAMHELGARFGDPIQSDGQEIELVMLGLGKLGAREPNYISDLDALFLYTGEGTTRRRIGGHRSTTTAANFFNEVAENIERRVNHSRDGAPLYQLGSSIAVGSTSSASRMAAISIDNFRNYFRRGEASLWQRLSLCKARAISGTLAAREQVNQLVVELLASTEWYPQMATQIRELRIALEQSAADDNLKRAAGGTVDVELITQTLQLRHASRHPSLLVPGTTDALQGLSEAGFIEPATAVALISNYRTLREVESKLCLLATPRHHEIPEDPKLLELLAFLMDESDGVEIMQRCRECRTSNRRLFNQVFEDLSR